MENIPNGNKQNRFLEDIPCMSAEENKKRRELLEMIGARDFQSFSQIMQAIDPDGNLHKGLDEEQIKNVFNLGYTYKKDEILVEYNIHEEVKISFEEPPQILIDLSKFFIPKNAQEFVIGDIVEQFKSDVEKNGERTAKLNLVKNILSSICPFVWGFVRAKFEKLIGRLEK